MKIKTFSIMNNGGFGGMTITRNGITMDIPREWHFNDGRVKKYAMKNINRFFKEQEKLRAASASKVCVEVSA